MLQAMNTGHDGSLTTDPRQHPARRAVSPRHDGGDGQPEHPRAGDPAADRVGRRPHRAGLAPGRRHAQGHRRSPRSPAWKATSSRCRTSSCSRRTGHQRRGQGDRALPRHRHPAEVQRSAGGVGHPLPMDMFEHVQHGGVRCMRMPMPLVTFVAGARHHRRRRTGCSSLRPEADEQSAAAQAPDRPARPSRRPSAEQPASKDARALSSVPPLDDAARAGRRLSRAARSA